MVSEKMGLPFYRRGRRRGRGRRPGRPVHNTNFLEKMSFFNNLLWETYPVNFHELFRVCLSRKGLLLCKFSYNQQSF